MENTSPIQATGRRKTSVAQVRLFPQGEGKVIVNAKTLDQFFGGLERHKHNVLLPLKTAEMEGKVDMYIKVVGGGVTGQAEAIRHAVARAVGTLGEPLRKAMRREGFLTRDDRMVERKKPGRPKARRRFQYSKR